MSGAEGQRRKDAATAGQRLRRADLALSTECRKPRTEAERQLAAIWQDVFRIDVVGVSDDFFDLGGDSFTATTLASEIEATFDTRFTPADIINLSTVAQQAEMLAKSKGAAPNLPACLILGRAGGSKSPLFMVHGGKGFAFFAPVFLDIVGEERVVYLFQAPGLDGRMTALESIEESTTVEEIAKLYIESMRTIQPTGPYYLAAMCAGSFIALEMCHQLESAGQVIGRLILLDPTPTIPRAKPQMKKAKEVAKRASKQGLGARFWMFFSQGRGPEQLAPSEPKQLDPSEMTRKKKKREKIDHRVEQMTYVPPEQRSYTAERMFKVSEQLRAALYRHVPRPYPGRVILLVCSSRVQQGFGDNGFWPNHLGNLQYEVLGSKHSDIFDKHLAETARFVRDALA